MRADPSPDASALAELQRRFVAAYPEVSQRSGRPLAALPNVYDAVYLLAYGLFAAPRSEGVADAEDLLTGFRRVTDESVDQSIEMGPGAQRLDSGLRLLQSGASIQLRGASGPHRFTARQHARAGQPRPYGIDREGQLLDADPTRVFDGASNLPD